MITYIKIKNSQENKTQGKNMKKENSFDIIEKNQEIPILTIHTCIYTYNFIHTCVKILNKKKRTIGKGVQRKLTNETRGKGTIFKSSLKNIKN